MPPTTASPDLLVFMLGQTTVTLQKITQNGSVNTDMHMTDYKEWTKRPFQAYSDSSGASIKCSSSGK